VWKENSKEHWSKMLPIGIEHVTLLNSKFRDTGGMYYHLMDVNDQQYKKFWEQLLHML
jgi:hypothetical protein